MNGGPSTLPYDPEAARCRGTMRGIRARIIAVGLAVALLSAASPPIRAADPQPYTVTISPTGEPQLDEALTDASTLLNLRDSAPVGPFALIARVQQDADRFVTVLRSFGYYKGTVGVGIAGWPVN